MNRNKYFLYFWAPAALLLMQSGIWAFVWINFYSHDIPRQLFWKGHLLVTAVYFIILFALASFYGGLRVGYYRASDVGLSGMIALVFANFITWAQVCLIGAAIMTPLPIMAMTAAQCIIIWQWAVSTNKLYARTVPPRRILMLYGGSELAKRVIYKIITRSDRYQIQESLCVNTESIETVYSRIADFEAVIFCDIPPVLHQDLQSFCFRNSIRIYTVPGIQDILIRGAVELNLFDMPLFLSRNQGLRNEQLMIKRALDVLLAGIALVVLSPLILLTALAVKLCDKGSVIYAQERLTFEGRQFMLYKFRSMKAFAEKNGAQLSTQNDDRITPVGKVIRPLRLDELPQLINILKGDMSIVGPRPERPEIVKEYLESMPEFAYRLKVKAGLTGYAQVFGNYNTDPWDKLLMDMIYISNYSLILDLKIMLMTVKILFQRERTEGIEKGKLTPRKKEKRGQ